MRRDLARDRPNVVERHRAHLAEGLRDDQVRSQVAQPVPVELVDELAPSDSLAHRGVDLRGRQAGPDQVAGHPGAVGRGGRVVALVGHGDNLVVEPESEQRLGRRRNQRDDPHGETIWHCCPGTTSTATSLAASGSERATRSSESGSSRTSPRPWASSTGWPRPPRTSTTIRTSWCTGGIASGCRSPTTPREG